MSLKIDIDGRFLSNSKTLLREDDSLLRQIFFGLLKRHHPELANKVDVIYGLSKSWCEEGCLDDLELLANYIQKLEAADKVIVASSFSHTLNLHNLTEAVSGVEDAEGVSLEEMEFPLRMTTKSIKDLEKIEGFSPNEIFQALSKQSMELVFTAHPTQALKREIVSSYRKMQNMIGQLHNTKMGGYEREECLGQLQGLIQTAWRTDEIHRSQPTPQEEMRAGLASFIDVIFPTLPTFLRRLDSSLMAIGQPRIPLDHALIK